MAYEKKYSIMLEKVKPYVAMISLQFGYAGLYIITQVSLKKGLNHFVLSVYRQIVATAVIAPFALILERKTRPKMTFPIFFRILALGVLNPILLQNFYNLGMKYTSTSFASATVNTLPAMTFILAIIFRLEAVSVKKMSSLAKAIGTTVTVIGALVMVLYKGPVVNFLQSKGARYRHGVVASGTDDNNHFVAGTLMLLASILAWSGFFILQSFTLKKYPAPLTLTALICSTGALEGTALTLAFEHNMSVWIIGWDMKLLSVVYSGVVCSAIAFYLQGAIMRLRGPVFVTAFSPLCMIITTVLGLIILAEKLHLGSVIGAILTGMGLYIVVWGMSKEYTSCSVGQLNEGQEVASVHPLPIAIIDIKLVDHKDPQACSQEATDASMASLEEGLPASSKVDLAQS